MSMGFCSGWIHAIGAEHGVRRRIVAAVFDRLHATMDIRAGGWSYEDLMKRQRAFEVTACAIVADTSLPVTAVEAAAAP